MAGFIGYYGLGGLSKRGATVRKSVYILNWGKTKQIPYRILPTFRGGV